MVLRSDDGEERVFWILGEGDRTMGEDVVSYRAPLGGMLLGKKVGGEVGPLEEKLYRVVAIRKRLPEPDE